MSAAMQKSGWQKIARRIRVPLGFVVAAVFLIVCRPTRWSMLASVPLVMAGLWLRGYAAGYVRKNAELTVTGPYAYTRNPLYLGSMSMAIGFAIAANRVELFFLVVGMFLAIYLPTIASEEAFLRQEFPEFDIYCEQVPRLLPRLKPALLGVAPGKFSAERYRHHREYNALVGAAGIYAVLLVLLLRFPGE